MRHYSIDEEADLFAPDFIDEDDSPADAVTAEDLIILLRKYAEPDDKIVFRCKKKNLMMNMSDIKSKGGVAVVDLDPSYDEDNDFSTLKEGRSSYFRDFGGYAGTGRAPSRDRILRGRDVSWFPLQQLDPRLRGTDAGIKWRMGPVNYEMVHKDILYPERVYKPGTTFLRNVNVTEGPYAGQQVYIALPSYFDAVVKDDADAKSIITSLGLPLNMTFGMNPRDDYTSTYTVR